MDWGFYAFVLDVGIVISTIPLAYLTWASGTLNLLAEQARKRHWINRPDPTDNSNATQEWNEQFGNG